MESYRGIQRSMGTFLGSGCGMKVGDLGFRVPGLGFGNCGHRVQD